MSNPYLSLQDLSALSSLADDNKVMVQIAPSEESGQGIASTLGYVSLSDFRDSYLLVTVNEEIIALQNKPGNGAFASPITMFFDGVVSGQVSFDGTQNVTATLSMPANSIPISAVTNLSSTLANLQAEVNAPPTVGAAYYANISAASQTDMMGYWDGSTTGLSGQDSTGVVMQFTSDASNAVNASNYVSQLLFGNAGTLTWRRNVNNGAWSQVSLWHSGNFNPAGYVQINSSPSFQRIYLGTNLVEFYQDGTGDTGDLVIAPGAGGATPVYYTFGSNGTLIIGNGGITTNGNISLPNGEGLVWSGGAAVITGPAGQSTLIIAPSSSSNILELAMGTTSSNTQYVYWDGSGNQLSTANITTTGQIKSATGIHTSSLAVGGTAAAVGGTVDVVTTSGHLLLGEVNGTSGVSSVNAANSAYAVLTLYGSSYSFPGGAATFSNSVSATALNASSAVSVTSAAALGTTAGSYWNPLIMQITDSNVDNLVVQANRVTAGTSWASNSWTIYRKVDATAQGFIQFGEATGGYGISMGSGSTTLFSMNQSGQVAIGSNAVAGIGGAGFAVNSGFGLLLARGTSGVNYFDSVNTANSAYQALQINAASLTVAASTTINNQLTILNGIQIGSTAGPYIYNSGTGMVGFRSGTSTNYYFSMDASGNFNALNGAVTAATRIQGPQGFFNSNPGGFGSQGGYIQWNTSGGTGEMDFINNQGGGSGGFFWYNTSGTGSSLSLIMQLSGSGALTTTGTANFNTSDRRLKKNIRPYTPTAYHRDAPFYTYDRKDIDAHGQGPMAQHVLKVNAQHVNEYLHMDKRGKRHVKRLAIDKTGVALEQAYWASYEVDALRAMVNKLVKRLEKLEAQQKQKRK
jgi:hypothetical protein